MTVLYHATATATARSFRRVVRGCQPAQSSARRFIYRPVFFHGVPPSMKNVPQVGQSSRPNYCCLP